ncbi:VanZ family protein [Pengzhenrongella sicca]|uniref:VanZ family protein n=1 Tax=Pengzhenrongella sicca TaxID=2819238 RepID=UPI001D0C172A|nr:VanZ family protein [Pengzhenrongella sicca]
MRRLFVVYLVLLVWAVLWKFEAPWAIQTGERIVKLVPFVAAGGAGASAPVEVAVNVLLFMPFGLSLGLLTSWPRRRAVGTMAAASIALEFTQYVLAVGSSDLTDVIANTAGGVVGLGLFALAHRRLQARTVPVLTRACAVAMLLSGLAVAIIVATPLSYAPPRDYRCDPPHSQSCGPPDNPGRR